MDPMTNLAAARSRLIVALDLPDVNAARALIGQLENSVSCYKIGMELAYAGGLDLVKELVKDGKDVFVDLKLHDIPNTVEKAAGQIAALQVQGQHLRVEEARAA